MKSTLKTHPMAGYFDLKNPRVTVAEREAVAERMAVERGDGLEAWGWKGARPSVFKAIGDQPTLWESLLPDELLVLPVESARVDALLDDPVFFGPFEKFFDPALGRPSIPIQTWRAICG